MPTAHTCLVSVTDTNNIRRAVEVAATTLYEAATLAMAEFRRMRIHGERTRPGDAAHGDRERAIDIARGPVGQGRDMDSECREAE